MDKIGVCTLKGIQEQTAKHSKIVVETGYPAKSQLATFSEREVDDLLQGYSNVSITLQIYTLYS